MQLGQQGQRAQGLRDLASGLTGTTRRRLHGCRPYAAEGLETYFRWTRLRPESRL